MAKYLYSLLVRCQRCPRDFVGNIQRLSGAQRDRIAEGVLGVFNSVPAANEVDACRGNSFAVHGCRCRIVNAVLWRLLGQQRSRYEQGCFPKSTLRLLNTEWWFVATIYAARTRSTTQRHPKKEVPTPKPFSGPRTWATSRAVMPRYRSRVAHRARPQWRSFQALNSVKGH